MKTKEESKPINKNSKYDRNSNTRIKEKKSAGVGFEVLEESALARPSKERQATQNPQVEFQ